MKHLQSNPRPLDHKSDVVNITLSYHTRRNGFNLDSTYVHSIQSLSDDFLLTSYERSKYILYFSDTLHWFFVQAPASNTRVAVFCFNKQQGTSQHRSTNKCIYKFLYFINALQGKLASWCPISNRKCKKNDLKRCQQSTSVTNKISSRYSAFYWALLQWGQRRHERWCMRYSRRRR